MMKCKICNKEFENVKELTKHLAKEHNYTAKQIYEYYEYSFESGKATCPICGKEFTMTKRQMDGFRKNPNKSIGCCISCSKAMIMVTHECPLSKDEIKEKVRKTLVERYGVEHPVQNKEIARRMKDTNLKRYGVENTFQVEEYREKSKKTNLKKFGTEYAIGSKEVREKAHKTIKDKYGVDNVFQSEEIKEKIKQTNLENFGVEHAMQSKEIQNKMAETNLEKYGTKCPMQSPEIEEEIKKKCLEKYGVERAAASPKVKNKIKKTMIERYGVENPLKSPEIKEKLRKTNLRKYGVEYVTQVDEVREKMYKTTFEKYGVKYYCQLEECYGKNYRRISKLNKKFQNFLNENRIENELEYVIEDSGYDLKVADILIEIDPWFTHNSTVGPRFGKKPIKPRDPSYHSEKTRVAKEHGFNCIHIFDWDEWDKVAMILQDKKRIFARKCEIKEISKKVAKEFLENYHLQGSTRSVKYAYGLYYEDELVEVMTFGKPRYNKNYEYELLRLCTHPRFKVVGGAGKLLKYFEEQVKPSSLLSYCDLSKFNGEVYEKLGFEQINQTAPARHWYNPKTKVHITDNLLRQRGFDQLHGTNFGKGTSNEQLMLENGYVEIYDCGQLVFVKNY